MLVTGASGFLGGHLVRRAAGDAWQVAAPTSHAMDITDRDETLGTIAGRAPDVIVHLAYRKDDRGVIVDGTRHVAEAAAAIGSRFVHISTDALFAGRPEPYLESDRPDPITEYGRNKAEAESIVATLVPSAVIIRTSLLYGTDHPSPTQLELETALASGRSPMTYFSDEFRCPVHAADVADAIISVAAHADLSGVLHVAGPEAVSRPDLARALAHHAGLGSVELPVTTIGEAGVVRPARVVLDTSMAASIGITCRRLDDALAT
jgi:dTDP-4-dehydrorhamnose reductase